MKKKLAIEYEAELAQSLSIGENALKTFTELGLTKRRRPYETLRDFEARYYRNKKKTIRYNKAVPSRSGSYRLLTWAKRNVPVKDSIRERIDYRMIDLVRNLSHVSCQFRCELCEVL